MRKMIIKTQPKEGLMKNGIVIYLRSASVLILNGFKRVPRKFKKYIKVYALNNKAIKIIIWCIGGMASGKSTQRRLLCSNLSDDPKQDFEGELSGINYCFSAFGNVAALGKVKDRADNMCDGLDAAFGTIKKEGGELSLHIALEKCDVVIIEGSQTSLKWFDFIKPLATEHNANIYLIHFKLSYEDNLNRLRQRQAKKLDLAAWEETKLSDKNIESIIGKNNQFNNIYDKLKNQCYALQIDALKPVNVINEEIIDFIFRDPEGI